MNPPRRQYLDYDSRRNPRTSFSCVKCQKDLKPGQAFRRVQMPSGEPFVIHPEDQALVTEPTDWHFIGPDCAKALGLEWTHPPQVSNDPVTHQPVAAPLTAEQLSLLGKVVQASRNSQT